MLNKTLITLTASLVALSLFSGCSSKEPTPNSQASQDGKMDFYEPSKFRLKPVIGSRNDDARTVVDMGTLLKIWVAPYKGRNGVLTASHDIYAWAKMPDFVVGEEVPTAPAPDKGSGMVFNKKLPPSISAEEVDRSKIQDDENIQTFVNGLNDFVKKEMDKKELTPAEKKKKEEQTKADSEILNFIKQNNAEKGTTNE